MSYYELMEKAGAKAISQLQVDEIADIYGVIKECKEVFRSQRGLKDYCQNLVVVDPSGRFIPVNLFKKSPDLLPRAVEKGNIIVIRKMRIVNYRIGLQGNSIPTTTFTTFKADNMSLTEIKTPNIDCALRPVDHEAVKQVLRYATTYMSNLFTTQQKQRPLLKTSEIMQHTGNFFNYVGMITSIHRGLNNDRMNINMTDYTKNPKPYVNPYAIQCTLWDNHAKSCPFIQVGDYLLLENVSKKIHNNSLTINLHRSKPEDQFVHKLSTEDPRVKELLKRKTSAVVGQTTGLASSIRSEVINIRASSSFREIIVKELDKSETDVFYKTKASIVDYKPKSIDRWVQHWCATCHKTYQSQPIMRCQACGRNIEFVYQFALLLQDKEGLNLIAYVFKEDGNDLFKNIDPKDVLDSRDKKSELKGMIETICKSKAEYDIGLRAYFNLEGILNFRITNTKFIKE